MALCNVDSDLLIPKFPRKNRQGHVQMIKCDLQESSHGTPTNYLAFLRDLMSR